LSEQFWYAFGGFGAINILAGIIAYQVWTSSSFGLRVYKWIFGIGFVVSIFVFLYFLIWG